MKREAFDHAVRAAGAIIGENQLLVIGSQALHASVAADLPAEAARSVEVDVVALDDPDQGKADLIDGAIGEASIFHETYGYFAQGVSQSTAVLPHGWENRLIRYETPNTNGVVAWCLEIHDLWISKAVALRSKDVEFCAALVTGNLVDVDTLRLRLEALDGIDDEKRVRIGGLIERFSGSGRAMG